MPHEKSARRVGDVLELDRACELGKAGERCVVTWSNGRYMNLCFMNRAAGLELGDVHAREIKTGQDYAYLKPADHVLELQSMLDDMHRLVAMNYAKLDGLMPKPHDSGSAPPPHFTRYQIEMPVHDDIDPSALLERMQEIAVELIDEADVEDLVGGDVLVPLIERIENGVSVQVMEG